eukprot:tig00000737_g3809.t1
MNLLPVLIVGWAVAQILREQNAQREERRSLITSAEAGDTHSSGRSDTFRILFESGLADPTTTESDGYNLLHLAAIGLGDPSTEREALRIFRRLVESGLLPGDSRTDDGVTPLALAAGAGHAEAVGLLLEAPVDVNAADSRGRTALTRAADALAPAVRDSKGDTALIIAAGSATNAPARRGAAVDVIRALLDSGARIDEARPGPRPPGPWRPPSHLAPLALQANKGGTTALAAACARGNVPAVAALLSAGASANLCDRRRHTPLSRLCSSPAVLESDQITIARMLLGAGARIEHRTAEGLTPLHLAARSGRGGLCGALLDLGADPCATDYSRVRRTPVAWAKDDEVRRLIEDRRDALIRFSDAPGAPARAPPAPAPPPISDSGAGAVAAPSAGPSSGGHLSRAPQPAPPPRPAPRADEDDFVLVDVQRPSRPVADEGAALIAAALAAAAVPTGASGPRQASPAPPPASAPPLPSEEPEVDESPERRALREELTCPICWGIYADPLSIPNCNHSFCAEHLDDVIANGPSRLAAFFRLVVRCPLCRREEPSTEVYPNVELRARVREFLASAPQPQAACSP